MKRFVSIAVAAFVMAVGAAYVVPATPAEAGSAALSIAPKKNYNVDPGKKINDKLLIHNLDQTNPLQLTLKVIDFTYTDDSGTPKLLLKEEAPTAWSLKSYLRVPEHVTIEPGGNQSVNISLDMPKDQGPGSYYSAIIYSSGSGDGERGNVGLNATGTTLVFAQIPGPVDEDLSLQNFGAYFSDSQSDSKYAKFSMNKPKEIAYTLKNNGNVVESPVGSITYKYMFGKEQTIDNVNPNGSLALRGQIRTFISCLKLKHDTDSTGKETRAKSCDDQFLWPGLYTMHLDLYYGQNGNNTREVVGNSYFWYLPWWFLIPFLIIVAILIIVIWRFVNKVRDSLYGPKTTAKHRSKK